MQSHPRQWSEGFRRKRSAVIGGEPDDHREGLVPTEIIIAGMPPGILAHGRSFFHRAVEQGLAVAAARRGRSAGRSLPLKDNHDLRGADGPRTRHREAADDPPALGRVAVERVLQVLWTELAGPPAVFLRQHLVFHGLSTSSKRLANSDFYRIPTATYAMRSAGAAGMWRFINRLSDHRKCRIECALMPMSMIFGKAEQLTRLGVVGQRVRDRRSPSSACSRGRPERDPGRPPYRNRG